jgi:hypothetical protein
VKRNGVDSGGNCRVTDARPPQRTNRPPDSVAVIRILTHGWRMS